MFPYTSADGLDYYTIGGKLTYGTKFVPGPETNLDGLCSCCRLSMMEAKPDGLCSCWRLRHDGNKPLIDYAAAGGLGM